MFLLDRVKSLADSKGISMAELERLCGFGNGTLRKWSHQSPSVDKVVTVADKLNVSLVYLIIGKETSAIELTDVEQRLISMYRELDERDQRDLCEIAQLKFNRVNRSSSFQDIIITSNKLA